MPVELEEIALFGLFKLKDRTIQILEEHLPLITHMCKDLMPINIDSQKLQRLGFLRYPTGIYYRTHDANEFLLRPLKGSQWEFCINSENRIRRLSYIHQVQRLWFDLFDDHLFIPKSQINKRGN